MKKAALLILCSFLSLHVVCFSQSDSNAVYKNPKSPIPLRVRDLLNKMTVEEKVAQLESGWTLPAFGTFRLPSAVEGDHVNEALVLTHNGVARIQARPSRTGCFHHRRLRFGHRSTLHNQCANAANG